ncbi:MAG: hypothetical protein IV090_20135 [Candidatus Sericytochromatia bacterium]|nr:hypothetical protein [Candidatus Sericytochromatia bacterium]
MRYHLVIQAPDGDLTPFFEQFKSRGLQAELPNETQTLTWCGFHDWQVSSAELQAWFSSWPDSGLWLVLEPNSLLRGHPLSALTPVQNLPEFTSLAELTSFLAEGLAFPPDELLKQAETLMPSGKLSLVQSLRPVLPLFLSVLGLPSVLGSEPLVPDKTEQAPASPLSQIQHLAGNLTLQPLDQALCLKSDSAPLLLFVLGWLAAEYVAPLFCLDFEACSTPLPQLQWPAIARSVLVQAENPPLRSYLHCEPDGTPFGNWGAFADAWAYLLPQLPFGIRLELCLAPLALEAESEDKPNPGGIQRYAGILQKTGFLLEAAAPIRDSFRLAQALALAEWVVNGGEYNLGSTEALSRFCLDAEREMAELDRDYFVSADYHIAVPDGARRAFLGRRLFLRGFADVWDLSQSQTLMAECDTAQLELGSYGTQSPIQGAELLFQGHSGNFWSAKHACLNLLQERQLAEATQWWEAEGFQTMTDLVWEPASDVYLRLLLADNHKGIALLLLSSFRFETEIVTWFADGARGVSSSSTDLPDFSKQKVYYYSWPEGALSERIAAHWQQAEAYHLQTKSPILSLPDQLLGILPLIDQNLQLVIKAQTLF